MVKAIIAVCTLCLIISLSPRTFADNPALPYSYAVVSSDHKYIFVMLAPTALERDGIQWPEEKRRESFRLRSKYPASGLYFNDGSTSPLWVVKWYSSKVYVPSDGVHLIRGGFLPQNRSGGSDPRMTLSDEAFAFFAKGELLRSYKIGDLISSTENLPHSVSYFTWIDKVGLDDTARTFTVITLNKVIIPSA